MNRHTWLLWVGALGLAAASCGCGSRPSKPNLMRIAVIPKGITHDHWKSVHAGALQAAKDVGGLEILWEGPSKEDERQKQLEIVERFTSEGVQGIVLAPCDRQSLVRPIEAALKKGIPVVIFDSGLDLPEESRTHAKYLGYVATDNRQGGVEAAKRLIDLLKDKLKAKVLMVPYQKGSESTEQREAGFRETIKTAPNIEFIESPDEAGATVDSAQKTSERQLADLKDLDGIFMPNESSATGMLRALQLLNRTGQLKFVGFDGSAILINALEDGQVQGLVLQDPFDMGYQSVTKIAEHLRGQPLPTDRNTPTRLLVVTKENMQKPDIKDFYTRNLRIYQGQ